MADPEDPVRDANRKIVDTVKAALLAAPGEESEFLLITGLLETACTFAVTLNVNPVALSFMFAQALSEAEERVARVKAARRAEAAQVAAQAAQEAPAAAQAPQGPNAGAQAGPGGPNGGAQGPQDHPLTEAQVREIRARLAEGGRVH